MGRFSRLPVTRGGFHDENSLRRANPLRGRYRIGPGRGLHLCGASVSDRGRMIVCRREGERIFVGQDIEIMVTHARSGSARVLIMAPKEIRIKTPSKEMDRSDRDALKEYRENRQ